ncbi:MAG TPA: helix-hairpin-helix domain-containing protein, partial [Candidatus Binataceae bacterium]|nr:helix-hairpin-helix domain-containing protein [Candidatus Binataceae bacterium]
MRASDAAKPAVLKSQPLSLETSVATLSGIGPKRAAALAERGITTVRDLIFHLPSRYQDWRHLTPLNALVPGTV